MARFSKNKTALIQEIESLFPIDSEFKEVNIVGEQLLIEAVKDLDWRNLPDDILWLWREKCIQRDLKNSESDLF